MNILSKTLVGLISKTFLVVFLWFGFSPVFAIDIYDDPCDGESCFQVGIDESGLPDELQTEDGEGIRETIIQALNYILTFLGILLVVVIVYAGALLILSNGDDEAMGKAQKMILYAIAGVVLIVLSYTLVTFISNIMSSQDTNIEDSSGSGGGEDGNGNSGGGDSGGDNGGGIIGDGDEDLEAQIQDILDQLAELRAQEGNEELISALQDQLDALQAQVDSGGTDALEQQIKDLQDQLAQISNDSSNEEERKKLEEQIEALQNELYNTSTGTQGQISDLLGQLSDLEKNGKVSIEEIEALQKALLDLKLKTDGNEDLEKKYRELESLLNQLLENPADEKLLTQIVKEVETLTKTVEAFSEVRPRVIISYSRRSVPTTVSLSGEKTYIRGSSSAVIRNEDFHWSVVGPDGVLQQVGDGITREFLIEVPGRYVFFMDVDSPASDVLGDRGIQSFTANPRETEVSFSAGEKTSFETLRFTQTQNDQGVIFNPSLVVPRSGRSIVRYVWNFGGYKVEETEGKPVLYSFPKTGNTYVSLEVTDNAGSKKSTRRIPVEISAVDAYFKMVKTRYKIDESVKFSATKSKSDNGFIQEYDWEVIDENGSVVQQFAGEEFSSSFSQPGSYVVRLTVRDNDGETASYIQSFTVVSGNPVAYFLSAQSDDSNPALWSFDASTSFDSTGSALSYSWDFDGDNRYDKINLTDPEVTYQFEKQGPSTVRLKVKNQYGNEDVYSSQILVDSLLQVEIESDKLIYTVDEVASFTALSDLGDSFQWNFDDGSGVSTVSQSETTHVFNQAGSYLVSLLAKSSNGGEATDTKKIIVRKDGLPAALATVSIDGEDKEMEANLCGSGKHGVEIFRSQSLALSGKSSVNSAGRASGLQYEWNISGNKKIGERVSISFPDVSSPGNCEEVSLVVTDDRSGNISEEEKFFIFVKNAEPKLKVLYVSPASEDIAPVSVSVRADAKDEDGKITSYTWWAERVGSLKEEKFGLHTTSGNSSVVSIPAFGGAGERNEYQFFVEVMDEDGSVVSSKNVLPPSDTVVVNNGDTLLPHVSLTTSAVEFLIGEPVLFTAVLKDGDGDDVSQFASYKWDFDGDGIYDKDSVSSSVSHKYQESGTYSASVKVLYQGNEVSDSSKVTVGKARKLPRAVFTAQKVGDRTILFSAESSQYDKSIAGNALQYDWDFNIDEDSDGDGIPDNDVDSKLVNVLWEYPSEDTFVTASLTVSNADGESDTIEKKLLFDEISGIVSSNENADQSTFENLMLQVEGVLQKDQKDRDEEEIKNLLESLDNVYVSAFTEEQRDKIVELRNAISDWSKDSSVTQSVQDSFDQVADVMGYERTSAPLLSDKSMRQMSELAVILESTGSDDNPLSPEKVVAIKESIASLADEIDESNPLYDSYQDLKNSLEILDQDPENEEALKSVKKNFQELQKAEKEAQKIKILWKPLSEMGEKINKSVQIEINTIATILDVYGGERYIQAGEEIIFFVFVKNADGTFYSGPLELKVLEGDGVFQPSLLKSISGRGVGSFTPSSGGVTVIEVTATDTISGSISETLTFFIQE